MNELIFEVIAPGIGRLTVNRPAVRNALNWQTQAAFAAAVDEIANTPDLRAVIITGTGQAFLSGADLSEMQHYPTRADGRRLASIMGDALNRLESLPVVTIAAINGAARGGGAEVAVACDLRLMAAEATIAFVHARLGLIPGWGGGERLFRLVGPGRALELLAATQVLTAEQAEQIGLVNQVVAGDQLPAAAEALAGQIARNSAASIKTIKQLFVEYRQLPALAARQAEREAFIDLWDRDERREAFRKINQK